MISKLLLAGAAVLALAGSAAAQHEPGVDPATGNFIHKAAQTDEFERQEGRLAEHRARSAQVRRFAAEMVRDHTKTTQGLIAAIRKAGLPPPPSSAPPPLSPQQQQMISDLNGRHGMDFDRTYVQQQIDAHQDALGLVQGYAQNGTVGPIKDAAQKTLPIVQHHLMMAHDIQSHIGA